MKLRWTETGVEIDAQDLGPLLGLAPADVPLKMRSGAITSRSEQGVDEDIGRHRLTFWYDDRRVRIICDAEGNMLKTTRSRGLPRDKQNGRR